MDTQPFRLDFVVPDDVDIDEPPPEGKTVFEGEVVPNPLLETLRAALDPDPRWTLERVAPLRPDGDVQRRQHLVVWVSIDPKSDDATLLAAQRGVQDIVMDVIFGASLVGVDQTSL